MAVVAESTDKRAHFEAAGREFEALLAEAPDDAQRMRNVALVSKNLVDIYNLQGARAEADGHAARAAELDAARLAKAPNDRQTRLDAAISFAQLGTRQRDERERLALYERSLALREQVAAEDPSDRFARLLLRRSLAQVARARFLLGDRAPARADARRAVELFAGDASVDAADRQWRGWAHLILADATVIQPVSACAHLRQAVEDFGAVAAVMAVPTADITRVQARMPGCAAGASPPAAR
ncbi:MAG: hypothetical protein IT181_03420 [Acidobacteria bacterium]|nr:hypothetical protein [Acidobacteriota bacterium]